jgi:single stranded DNA-binding protein
MPNLVNWLTIAGAIAAAGLEILASILRARRPTRTAPASKDDAAADNLSMVVGSLTDDPELRYTHDRVPVAILCLAVPPYVDADEPRRKGGTGVFTVNVGRHMAENVAGSLSKGDRVVVTGRLRTTAWIDKFGQERSFTELEAHEVALSLKFRKVQGIVKPQCSCVSERARAPRRRSMSTVLSWLRYTIGGCL